MSKTKVLWIDDDSNMLEYGKMWLEATGKFVVYTLSQPNLAVKQCLADQPDVIILDLVMFDTDGAEVARSIRCNPKLANIPILFFTAYVGRDEVQHMNWRVGGEYFVSKATDLKTFQAILETITNARSVSSTSGGTGKEQSRGK